MRCPILRSHFEAIGQTEKFKRKMIRKYRQAFHCLPFVHINDRLILDTLVGIQIHLMRGVAACDLAIARLRVAVPNLAIWDALGVNRRQWGAEPGYGILPAMHETVTQGANLTVNPPWSEHLWSPCIYYTQNVCYIICVTYVYCSTQVLAVVCVCVCVYHFKKMHG